MGPTFTEPLVAVLNGSSLRIEFLLDEDHDQIEPLRLDQRADCIQNRAAVAALCDVLVFM